MSAPFSSNAREITTHFIKSLSSAKHVTEPFDYWLLDDIFPADVIHSLSALPLTYSGKMKYEGKRENNPNSRLYLTPDEQAKTPVFKAIVDGFKDPDTIRTIAQVTATDLSDTRLRMEYIQDRNRFWLLPHVDRPEKRFSLIVYLSNNPALRHTGTQILKATPEHDIVTTVPYIENTGMLLIPGENTWHGVSKRPIKGIRTSLVVNHVSSAWNNTQELS